MKCRGWNLSTMRLRGRLAISAALVMLLIGEGNTMYFSKISSSENSFFSLGRFVCRRRCLKVGSVASSRLILSVKLSVALCVWPGILQAQERVEFSQQLYWVTSGAWGPGGDLLLVDVLAESVVSVSRDGSIVARRVFDTATANGAAPKPSFLHVDSAGSYFLEDKRSPVIRIANLNSLLEVESQTNLNRTSSVFENGEAVLSTTYSWQPVDEGFVGFADLEYPDIRGPGQYKSAFVYFDSDGLKEVIGRTMEALSDVRNHYLRSMPYIATLNGGEDVFILKMEEVPSVVKLQLDQGAIISDKELKGFPKDFRTCPKLARNPEWIRARKGARQATTFYKKFETSKMAAGLYSWDGQLFLAVKDAMAPSGMTDWWMIELDPQTGSELGRVQLPTGAAHVTIVPGHENFAVIEKGQVEALGRFDAPYMPIASMMLVPSEWF